MDQKAKDLGDLGDSMSEEEAKTDVVDLTSDDEPKGHVGATWSRSKIEKGDRSEYVQIKDRDGEIKTGAVFSNSEKLRQFFSKFSEIETAVVTGATSCRRWPYRRQHSITPDLSLFDYGLVWEWISWVLCWVSILDGLVWEWFR